MDDLIITGGSILGVAKAFAEDTNVHPAKIAGYVKRMLWILGGILIAILALFGGTLQSKFG